MIGLAFLSISSAQCQRHVRRLARQLIFIKVEHGRMAYIGSVADDTEKILGREPLLLREWAKLHANELLEIAGS
jgi:hypothetical protein